MPSTTVPANANQRASSPSSKVVKTNGTVKDELLRSNTESSVSSQASSIFSSSSASEISSATSMSSFSSTTVVSKAYSGSYVPLHETCFNLEISNGILSAECLKLDGTRIKAKLDLNLYLGNIDGVLTWGSKGFSKSCKDVKIVNPFWLVAQCQRTSGNAYVESKFDLNSKFCNIDGVLAIIDFEQRTKWTKMLTEVPWMKFKVIAEPDLAVFAGHPVVKDMMVKIAESTVQHVTTQMSRRITTAVQEAIAVVTASAIRHIQTEMEMVVKETVGISAAHIHPSCTEGEYLHRMKPQDLTVCAEEACAI